MSASNDYVGTIAGSVLAASLFVTPLADEAVLIIEHNVDLLDRLVLKINHKQGEIKQLKQNKGAIEAAFNRADIYGLNGVNEGKATLTTFLKELDSTSTIAID